MTGPIPKSQLDTVAALFGPTAHLSGCLGTPTRPGSVTISTGSVLLGTAGTFQGAIEAATAKAATLAVNS